MFWGKSTGDVALLNNGGEWRMRGVDKRRQGGSSQSRVQARRVRVVKVAGKVGRAKRVRGLCLSSHSTRFKERGCDVMSAGR